MVKHRKHLRHNQHWLMLIATLTLSLGTLLPVTANASETASSAVTSPTTKVAPTTSISEHDYETQSALQLAQAVRDGKVTSTELVKQAIAKVKADNPQLNSVITLREDAALQEAASLQDTGQKFLGVPILIKGLGQTIKGSPNTDGLIPLKSQIAGGTTTIVRNLQSQGFIVIGQTNFPEMGLLNITDSKLFGPAHNPWNLAYNPGGSSGGSTASIADGMTPVASSSDAGGSIRIPASWSGVIGLKPSQGAISGDGSGSTATTVDFVDTKTMSDTEALFNGLKNSRFSFNALPDSLKTIPIAYSTKSPVGTPVSQDAINAVMQTVSFLKVQGFTVKEATAPTDGVALMKAYYLLDTSAGSVSNFVCKPLLGHDITTTDVSTLNWALYQANKQVTPEQVTAARETIATAKTQMATFHEQYPLYLTPTTATTAPRNSDPSVLPEYETKLAKIDQLASSEQQLQLIYDAWLHGLSKSPFTQQENLTGEPAISLPTYVSSTGLPLGIQLNAAKGSDPLLLKMGELFENHHQFKLLQDRQTNAAPSSAVPTISSQKPTADSTTPVTKTPAKTWPLNVYATKKVTVYQDLTGMKISHVYPKSTRAQAHAFHVLDMVFSHGHWWYHVKNGYFRTDMASNLYYQHTTKRLKTLRGLYEYSSKSLKEAHRKSYVHKGKILKVKRLVKTGNTTRYQLSNGHYVTANKKFVIWH